MWCTVGVLKPPLFHARHKWIHLFFNDNMTASREVETVFSPLLFWNEEAFRSWGEMVKNVKCGKFMYLLRMTWIIEDFLCNYDQCCSGHRALQKSQGNTLICRNLVTWLLFKISRKSIPLTIIQTLLCTFQIHTCSLHYFTTVLLIFLNSFTGHPVFLSALLPHSLFFLAVIETYFSISVP